MIFLASVACDGQTQTAKLQNNNDAFEALNNIPDFTLILL